MWTPLVTLERDIYTFKYLLKKINSVLVKELKDCNDFPHGSEYGLFGGKSGIALFLSFYNNSFSSIDNGGIIESLIEEIYADISSNKHFFTLANGIVGELWTLQFINQIENFDNNPSSNKSKTNQVLFEHAKRLLQEGNYDLMHGGLGVLIYLLRCKEYELVEEGIDVLASTALYDQDSKGFKWYFPKNGKIHTGAVNIGLSHGIPAIASFLVKAKKRNIKSEKLDSTLLGICRYLLHNIQDVNKYGSYFSYIVGEGIDKSSFSRLAWCYGDLGVGYTLLSIAKVYNNQEIEEVAMKVLMSCCTRLNPVKNQIFDAGLCHGAVGAAHIFNRLYQATQVEEFRNASTYWYKHVLEINDSSSGLAGFVNIKKEKGEVITYTELGFLEGIAGIGLGLLSAISDTEPEWDELLFLS